MSLSDKAQNKAQEFGGKAEETAGDLTGDRGLQAEGVADQAGAKIKGAGGRAFDKASDVVDDATDKVRDIAGNVSDQVSDHVGDLNKGHGVINRLHRLGLRSEHAYIAGFASIGISVVAWAASRAKPDDERAQSDRWGIFVGHWAPTFMALGVALKLEEKR